MADKTEREDVDCVIRANGPDLLRYFLRRGVNLHDAEDLLGDAYTVLWRRRQAIPQNPDEARMWCYGVARRLLTHRTRTLDRANRLLGAEASRAAIADTGSIDPARTVEDSERAHSVRVAIEALNPGMREIVVLVHWDGFSLADAARHLHLNASTARTRYARARSQLAGMLADHHPAQTMQARSDDTLDERGDFLASSTAPASEVQA